MSDKCYNFWFENGVGEFCLKHYTEPDACHAGRENCKYVLYGITGKPEVKNTWTPKMLVTCYHGERSYFGSFLINAEGMVLARVREGLQPKRQGCIRMFKTPVNLNDAVESDLGNYTYRWYVEDAQLADLQKAVEDKLSEEGVCNEMAKQSKIVKTYAGFGGTMRYRDVKTGQFVSKK